jgi:serine/threonine protein kinase
MLYILYEYVNGGELWQKSTVYGIPYVGLIKYYYKQVLDGIAHLHSFDIVHRDIKVSPY